MSLSLADHEAMVAGISTAGYVCVEKPNESTNPIVLELLTSGQLRSYRLWAFDVTAGGGGPTVRAADEFRIQITNGPATVAEIDTGGATDLLVGYSREKNVLVAYDRRWLENWCAKAPADRGSPSVQVKLADIDAGHQHGMHRFLKERTSFGPANIVTMDPAFFPGFLLDPMQVLAGTISTAQSVTAVTIQPKATVFDYCRQRGFLFDPDLLARYIASFLAKPFVILSGVSGTGKSKIAELVAEFYSISSNIDGSGSLPIPKLGTKFSFEDNQLGSNPDRFAFVPVRPDWTDNQSILGFVNPITGQYESTNTLDLILRAAKAHKDASIKNNAPRHFLLLDEMNLARVEHYFSDWLACTESRRESPSGSITQQGVPLHRSNVRLTACVPYCGTDLALDVPGTLEIPTNLVVTGTVNVDETTHGFSPKVLDRSMVIEFDHVDLEQLRSPSVSGSVLEYSLPASLSEFEVASQVSYSLIPLDTHRHLVAVNAILEESRLHLGYRSANEIALFMRIYNSMLPKALQDASWTRPLDIAILQKILPRISGSRSKVESTLVKICTYANYLKLSSTTSDVDAELDSAAGALLPHTYARAFEMLSTARDFGFVSFFK
jgi:hypothetical protein